MTTYEQYDDPHYERAYHVFVDGRQIGRVYKRVDRQWTGYRYDGYVGTDISRTAITRRMLIGLPDVG